MYDSEGLATETAPLLGVALRAGRGSTHIDTATIAVLTIARRVDPI
jgi:hypothetical protein